MVYVIKYHISYICISYEYISFYICLFFCKTTATPATNKYISSSSSDGGERAAAKARGGEHGTRGGKPGAAWRGRAVEMCGGMSTCRRPGRPQPRQAYIAGARARQHPTRAGGALPRPWRSGSGRRRAYERAMRIGGGMSHGGGAPLAGA